jgi:hypothetical protein
MRYDNPVFVLIFAVLVPAMALFAALAGSAVGAVDPVRPEKFDQLPDKANGAAKEPTCRVVLTRPLIIFLKTRDGKIIPLGVLTSLRTRC